MSINTTRVLLGVLESLKPPVTFFLDKFFPNEVQSDVEEILFDVVDEDNRLAPFVSPLVRGKVMENQGHKTRVFKPAYLKPKNTVRPTDAIQRVAGEKLNGEMSMGERRKVHIRRHLQRQWNAIVRRWEVMCVEALRLGKVTVSGEGYKTQVIDFGRDPAHRIVLSGADLWTASTATPDDDLEEWAILAREADESDAALVEDVVLGTAAMTALRKWLRNEKPELLAILLNSQHRGQTTDLQMGPQSVRKVAYQGMLGSFRLWTYADTYKDENGNKVQVFPSNEVLLVAAEVRGTRCFGAIMDHAAGERGLAAMPIFPKMWVQDEPSIEFIMTQSAPLMVPLRPNATVSAVVTA
jgi:hypothetical protein